MFDWLASLFEPSGPGDTLEQARVRAYGVDPITGNLIAPQYAIRAEAAGYDPSNPQAFISSISSQVKSEFQSGFASSFDSSSGIGIGSILLIGLGVVLLLMAVNL